MTERDERGVCVECGHPTCLGGTPCDWPTTTGTCPQHASTAVLSAGTVVRLCSEHQSDCWHLIRQMPTWPRRETP